VKKKCKVAKKLGADFVINYTNEDMKEEVSKITNGKFADVIYECVGGEIFHKCVRSIGDQGRLLVVGFASGNIPDLKMNMPLVKGFSIVGVRSGESFRRHPEQAMEMFQKMHELAPSGSITPYIERIYKIDECKEAFKVLSERNALGKIVIQMDGISSKL